MSLRRLVSVLVVAVLASACATRGAPSDSGLVRITLLQVNDIYELEPVDGGRRGGVARLATLVGAAKRRDPNTVFVLAGDVLSPSVMSTFLHGEQMVAALNAVGLDLAVFGNHEFDFGPDVLAARVRESRFVWLASNVLDRRTGEPFGGARRDLLRTMGPITVGFLGLTTPATAVSSRPGPDVVFLDPLATARTVAADLRRRGARVVVAITHQYMGQDRALAEQGGIDVILGGHEHEPLVAEQGPAVITKAGSDGRYLVRVDLWLTPAGEIVERSWTFREVSRRVPPDPAVAALVHGYGERLDRALDAVVGDTLVPLEARRAKLRTEETNLGNFVADLVRRSVDTDVAIVNGGGIRTDRVLPAGPLRQRDVMSLLPFNNTVVTVAMSGQILRQTLEHGLAQADRQGGGFPQVSGIRLAYDPARPLGDRIVRLEVGAEPLDPARVYRVAVLDFLHRGGDGFTTIREARVLVDAATGPQLTAIVRDGIVARRTIAPTVEGRIVRLVR